MAQRISRRIEGISHERRYQRLGSIRSQRRGAYRRPEHVRRARAARQNDAGINSCIQRPAGPEDVDAGATERHRRDPRFGAVAANAFPLLCPTCGGAMRMIRSSPTPPTCAALARSSVGTGPALPRRGDWNGGLGRHAWAVAKSLPSPLAGEGQVAGREGRSTGYRRGGGAVGPTPPRWLEAPPCRSSPTPTRSGWGPSWRRRWRGTMGTRGT